MKAKIYAMLVCAMFAAAVLPSVSAAATTLNVVDDEEIYVFAEYNHTAADIKELLGLSLDENDMLYISYYNTSWEESGVGGGTMNHTSTTPTKDSNDIVWFNINIVNPTTLEKQVNFTNRQVFFDDATITDANFDDAKTALLINDTYDDDNFYFIVTIPDGVEFTHGDYSYVYDDNNWTINDEDGDEVGNITSWEHNESRNVYAMNLTDDDKSHQLVIYSDDLHATSTAVSAKRITATKYWGLSQTKVDYTMNTEATDDYSLITSSDGYVAFDVFKDYGGWLGAKWAGGSTKFKMSADSFSYDSSPIWQFWGPTWTEIETHESEINGIKVGTIEYIYLSKDTGEEDTDEIFKDNYGVITSKGEATTVSGLDVFFMYTSRTPEAVAASRATNFA